MKLLSIRIKNYGAFYGAHEFALDNRGLVLVLGDNHDDPRQNSNGASKSTLFEAIDWCLFGKVPRDDTVDSIINDEAQQDCSVSVELFDDQAAAAGLTDRSIRITRFRKQDGKNSGVSLIVDGKETTSLDTGETDKRICELLGLDREVFHALVFYQQGDRFNFCDATDAQRVEILTRVLQLDDIDVWLERFKAKEQAIEQQLAKQQGAKQALQQQLLNLQQTDYTPQLAQWTQAHADTVQLGEQQAAHLYQQCNQLHEAMAAFRVEELKGQLAVAKQALPQGDPQVLAKFQADGSMARGKLVEARQHLGGFKATDQRCRSQIVQFEQKRGGTCGTCGQPISPQHIDQHLVTLRAELEQVSGSIEKCETFIGQWEGWLASVEQAERTYREQITQQGQQHNATIIQLTEQIAAANQAELAFKSAEMMYAQAKQQLDTLKQQVNPFIAQQQNLEHQRQSVASDLAQLDHSDTETQKSLQYVRFWTQACGPKGVKSYVFDARLAELNESINRWLKLLFGGTHWARVETQTMGRSTGKLSNKINLRLFRHNPDGTTSERNYRSWSGGEKRRIGLAVDMGLSGLVAVRASKRYQLLILDEVFEHMDAGGREAVVDMLHQLQSEKTSLFVIDHDREMAGAFHNRITVTKQNRRASIAQETSKSHDPAPQIQSQQASETTPPAVLPSEASVRKRRRTSRAKSGESDPVH